MDFAGWTDQQLAEFRGRRAAMERVESGVASGQTQAAACRAAGVSVTTYWRMRREWAAAVEADDPRLFISDRPTGRPPDVVLSAQAAIALRSAYIRSNLSEGKGSMTLAARFAARDQRAPLTDAEREYILRRRASKHSIPAGVRRACRASDAAVAVYRDSDAYRLGGLYAPGCMRSVREPDGSLRRLRPGERWSVDDGSINFLVVVPWPWGGDPCSDRHGVRVGRFQLLPAIDDATDHCVGWGYVIRGRDSYQASDVVATLAGIMRHAYRPERLVVEGGAWQAARTLDFLRAAGIPWDDAKGRPHSKLIESWFNRLWTVLSVMTDGQIGRYRGEMDRETDLWMRCQRGALDPSGVFPTLEQGLHAIGRAVAYVNAEQVESSVYGRWIPQDAHAAGLAVAARPALTEDLAYLALRERHQRTVRRSMVAAAALCPLGFPRPYVFGGESLIEWEGARVNLHFDPFASPVLGSVTLAAPHRDAPAGTLLARGLPCLNSAAEVLQDEAGAWRVRWSDGLAEAMAAKRLAQSAIRRELRVAGLDGSRMVSESTLSAPEGTASQTGLGTVQRPAAVDAHMEVVRPAVDIADLERFERENSVLTFAAS